MGGWRWVVEAASFPAKLAGLTQLCFEKSKSLIIIYMYYADLFVIR